MQVKQKDLLLSAVEENDCTTEKDRRFFVEGNRRAKYFLRGLQAFRAVVPCIPVPLFGDKRRLKLNRVQRLIALSRVKSGRAGSQFVGRAPSFWGPFRDLTVLSLNLSFVLQTATLDMIRQDYTSSIEHPSARG